MRFAVTVSFVLAVVTFAAPPGARAQPRDEHGPAQSAAVRVTPRRAPSLSDLPTPGAPSGRSAELAAAWRLVDAALHLRAPRPSGRTLSATTRWTRERFAPWIRRKTEAIRVATEALTGVAARTDGEAVVAIALLGLLHEDLATGVAGVAPPPVIAADVRLNDAYMDALESQARALFERASAMYERCARPTGPTGPVASAYRHACETRLRAVTATLTETDERSRERDRAVAAMPPPPDRRVPTSEGVPVLVGLGPVSTESVLGILREEPAPATRPAPP